LITLLLGADEGGLQILVQPRGEEIAERTEEETEIEDEGILDLDLVRLLRRLVLDLGLALARESGTAEESEMNEVDDATIARDLDRRLREEESLGVTTMTTIKITRWMMAVNKDAEGHLGETRRTDEETGRHRIRVQGLLTSGEEEEEGAIESIRSRRKKDNVDAVEDFEEYLKRRRERRERNDDDSDDDNDLGGGVGTICA
jgi:hypothetical protein